ncbi:oxidoreductase [Aureimonas endophytica]|uniref:Oxidoreductase n=1 Tax=Aureimonas endophytica TaxID=2027858 RepID=A0A916ZHS1_9HYPH|nr:molybdopterin-dependent oxidoreductase [Aureimonas endophytica]GGD98728.1 oxidoreductase [Aureimonas endophytica]
MTPGPTRRFVLAAGLGLGAAAVLPPSRASALPLPGAKPILRIGGRIATRNEGEEAVFDLAMLEGLGTRRLVTSTPWTQGVMQWDGVPLATLMAAVGAEGTTIRATALNDYVADVPMAGLAEDGVILASRREGKPMPVSDKGPLFILYPFDDDRRLQQQSYYMRCAWQIARLDIL